VLGHIAKSKKSKGCARKSRRFRPVIGPIRL
jgi:hypothetical protein